MKERSGPRGAQSHLTEKENQIRATGARSRHTILRLYPK